MNLEDLDKWIKSKPQIGDVAQLVDTYLDKRYLYFYKGPDDNPGLHIIDMEFAADIYQKEINKLKVEEPKMEKRCDNCKYFKNMPGSFSWCSHKDHAGALVQVFTTCTDHEPKQQFTGPFDNLKFFVKDQQTGELEVKYICEDCSKIMTKPFHWQLRVPFGANKDPDKRPGYYYWCEECWEKEKKK
jgi:hypothetical protein